jgi:hypothetical protein
LRGGSGLSVGLVAPPWLAVPPERYGGVEWVVSLLADGLVELGHDVTLFAAGGSITRAALTTTSDEPLTASYGRTLPELRQVLAAWQASSQFDLISDHSGLLGAAMADLSACPVVHTVYGPLDGEAGALYPAIAHQNPRLRFISLTLQQREPLPDLPWAGNCPMAIDLDAYPASQQDDGYLLFLGRMAPQKGAHSAIAVAERCGLPLKIAGKMHDVEEREYFARMVQPRLSSSIEWVGEVRHEEKVRLLQRARATLFPIDWEEPFGLAMIESMACGTPVVATRRGAVPEVVADGVSGVIVDGPEGLADGIEAARAISADSCRTYVEDRFSDRRMVRAYEEVFREVMAGHA